MEKPPISRRIADEIELRSALPGSINALSSLRRSLLLAELSMIAYLPKAEARRAAARLNVWIYIGRTNSNPSTDRAVTQILDRARTSP